MAEELAAEFLKRNGYRVIERNWSSGSHEIDIVAAEKKKRNTLCFVEIRARRSGPPVRLSQRKIRAQLRAARAYLNHKRIKRADIRFDLLYVRMPAGVESSPELELHKGAFTTDDA